MGGPQAGWCQVTEFSVWAVNFTAFGSLGVCTSQFSFRFTGCSSPLFFHVKAQLLSPDLSSSSLVTRLCFTPELFLGQYAALSHALPSFWWQPFMSGVFLLALAYVWPHGFHFIPTGHLYLSYSVISRPHFLKPWMSEIPHAFQCLHSRETWWFTVGPSKGAALPISTPPHRRKQVVGFALFSFWLP